MVASEFAISCDPMIPLVASQGAVAYVLLWASLQLGLPLFLTLPLFFLCGFLVGRYWAKVDRLAKERRERPV